MPCRTAPIRRCVHRPVSRPCRAIVRVQLLLCALLFILLPSVSLAQFDLERFRPATLSYTASKFFISAETQVKQYLVPSGLALDQLLDVPDGKGLLPNQDKVVRQTILTDALGLQSQIDVWLNPNASVLQQTSLSSGRKDRYRLYRYMPQGAYSVKRLPANDQERGAPVKRWSKVAEDYYHLQAGMQDIDLSKAEALFYVVSVADLHRPGDHLVLPVLDDEEIIYLSMTVKGSETMLVNFDEITDSGTREVSERMKVLRVRVSADPLDPRGKEKDFEFLGYKGDIDLYVDTKRRIIVQLTGAFDYLGTVDIRLKQVDYRL